MLLDNLLIIINSYLSSYAHMTANEMHVYKTTEKTEL